MPVVHEDQFPVMYDDWDHWRRYRGIADMPELSLPPASFCGLCWGQGRIHEAARNGEGYVPRECEACHGSGRSW